MIAETCTSCGAPLKPDAKFCPSCGKQREQSAGKASLPSAASAVRHPMSKRTKRLYGLLAAVLIAIFMIVFIQSLPGGAHPVIANQPEIAMPSANSGLALTAQPIAVKVEDGKIKFPLALLLEKKMVQFDYQGASSTTPLLAYISAEGKLITAVRICEPCNSKTFRIEGTELCCGNCETRWKLNNLEGLQGSCQKYPPDPVPSAVVGNEVQIDEAAVLRWKMRI